MKRLSVMAIGILACIAVAGVATAAEYNVDPSHSTVSFTVRHMVINKVRGSFNTFSGTIMMNDKNMVTSIKGVIDATSIDTNNEKRDGHLKSPDFFDTEKFPEITFESTEIKKKGDGYVAHGKFTMRGVTKEVAIPFTITETITDPWGNVRFGLEAEAKINRHDYDIKWSQKLDGGGLVVADDVNIELAIEAVKAK